MCDAQFDPLPLPSEYGALPGAKPKPAMGSPMYRTLMTSQLPRRREPCTNCCPGGNCLFCGADFCAYALPGYNSDGSRVGLCMLGNATK